MRFFAPLFLFISPSLSFALSLGDIELKSHLGEPLNAKVEVTDSEIPLDAGCFTAVDTGEIPAFRKASIALKQNNGNQLLSITSNQAITEPIVNLHVTFHCEPRIDREYVLLIDPEPLASAEISTSEKTTDGIPAIADLSHKNKSASKKSKTSVYKQQNADDAISLPNAYETEAASTNKLTQKQRAKNRSNKKRSATSSIDDKLMQAYVGKQASASVMEPMAALKDSANNETVAARTNTDKPFLTISGGNASAGENNTQLRLSLRLETQLDLNRPEAGAAPLSATEAMDEVTVMANRLAHLEKQILSLQDRNLQLQAAAEKAKNEGFRLSPNQAKWLNNILIGLGIVAALAFIEWLRRKLLRDRLNKNEAIWFDAEAGATEETTLSNNSLSDIETTVFGDSMFDSNLSSQSLANNAPAQAEKSESENILEHAEVFIAHGRPVLAIQLLQNHLEDSPTESPTIWLKLLSLLAKEGSESEYEATVRECNQFFNVKMPKFAEAASVDTSSIEDHPHIVDRLQGVWGSQFAIGFLDDLIYNQQAQPREGFERGTFEELFFLKQIAEILQSSNILSQNAAVYRPENIQPALEKVAVNQTLFAAANLAEESSALPMPPVSEVDLLLDIEETPAGSEAPVTKMMMQASSGPETVEDFQVIEIDFPDAVDAIEQKTASMIESMEELVFESDMADTLEFNQDELKQVELKTEAIDEKTNVIEFDWDLPKINKD